MSEINLESYLQQRKAMVDSALEARLPTVNTDPRPVHDARRSATLSGGKRLRPIFSLAVAEMAGETPELFLDAACAIEFAHTASLILDDLPCMDNANTRRGMPCVHLKFGEATALLAAMALLSSAFDLVARNAVSVRRNAAAAQAVAILANALGSSGLVQGQHLDLILTGKHPPLETLEHIYHLKAGALFLAAVRIPAQILGLPDSECGALDRFANSIGLAFQITDDLLDAERPSEDIGKNTFASLLGQSGAQVRAAALIADAIAALTPFGSRAGVLRQLAAYVQARHV